LSKNHENHRDLIKKVEISKGKSLTESEISLYVNEKMANLGVN
jgi:hypothetical protein